MSESSNAQCFAADFSEAGLGDGLVSVFLREDAPVVVGQHVQLIDAEGNTAPGIVRALEKHVAWVAPQLDRVSLNPLDFEDALRAALQTKPERGR